MRYAMRRTHALVVLMTLLMAASAPRAADAPHKDAAHKDAAAKPAEPAEPTRVAPPVDVTTDHTLRVGNRQLAYRATAGTLPLQDDKGETTADLFYVAYA